MTLVNDDIDHIVNLLSADTTELGEINYIEAQVALRSAYNDNYGLHNGPAVIEEAVDSPRFAGTLFEDIADIYHEARIKSHFGISLDEFMEKTREQRLTLQRLATKYTKKELAAAETEEGRLNSLLNGNATDTS